MNFFENYYGLEEKIEDATFSTLRDWDIGLWLLFLLYGPFLLAIPASIYRIEPSWSNIVIFNLILFGLSIFSSILAKLLSRNLAVQRYVFKKLSASRWSFFTIEREDLKKALVYLGLK